MTIIAYFHSSQYKDERYDIQEIAVGISLSQEYHQNSQKIFALFKLLKEKGFRHIHVIVSGELEGFNLMIANKDLPLEAAQRDGRILAEQWVEANSDALRQIPTGRLTITYYDEVLRYESYTVLKSSFKNMRTNGMEEYDPIFAKFYNETKGAFVANFLKRQTSKGNVSKEEFARISDLVEQYIDGELIQLRMWANQRRPYAHILYPKEKPPVIKYYYEHYLCPEVGTMFSDLVYGFDNKPQKQLKQEPYSADKVYADLSRKIMEIESYVEDMDGTICKLKAKIFSLKAKAKRVAASGDSQDIVATQKELDRQCYLFRQLTGTSPPTGSPDQSPPRSPMVTASVPSQTQLLSAMPCAAAAACVGTTTQTKPRPHSDGTTSHGLMLLQSSRLFCSANPRVSASTSASDMATASRKRSASF